MPKVFSAIDVKPVLERVLDIKPNQEQAIDVKPNSERVLDVKPNSYQVIDTKPLLDRASEETIIYMDTRSISAGQPMGLLLALTYPTSFTFTAPRI